MVTKRIFPIARAFHPLSVEVEISGGRVVDAKTSGLLYRGFEEMLVGHDPRDAVFYTQRICGICSSAHAIAANYALQAAFRLKPTPNGQLLTNIIFAADIIQNHIRHFYLLSLLDYVRGPDHPPFTPRLKGDYRLPQKINDQMFSHYWEAHQAGAKAHEMLTVFGAKAPHQQTIYPTGVTERATAERIERCRYLAGEIAGFVTEKYLPDVLTIAEYYKDYYAIGVGYKNFLCYGMFPDPVTGERAIPSGVVFGGGPVQPLDVEQITEEVRYSWYRDEEATRKPTEGKTAPDMNKPEAYSWVKAPRYQGLPCEGGPLAQLWIAGEYRRGVSVMDRHVARALMAQKLCSLINDWLDRLAPGQPTIMPYEPQPLGEGAGLTDAMRGPLGHWVKIEGGKIKHYQIITPSAWNFSPRDNRGIHGPAEEALNGTPCADPEHCIEVGRVVRSFDPCFSCAIHAITPQGSVAPFQC